MSETSEPINKFGSPEELKAAFAARKYLLPDKAATVLFLAGCSENPFPAPGRAGAGKTEILEGDIGSGPVIP